jgi:hypothetical protein
MEKDERLETLCEVFSGLEEKDKDYLLTFFGKLAFPTPAKNGNFYGNTMPLPVGSKNRHGYNHPL